MVRMMHLHFFPRRSSGLAGTKSPGSWSDSKLRASSQGGCAQVDLVFDSLRTTTKKVYIVFFLFRKRAPARISHPSYAARNVLLCLGQYVDTLPKRLGRGYRLRYIRIFRNDAKSGDMQAALNREEREHRMRWLRRSRLHISFRMTDVAVQSHLMPPTPTFGWLCVAHSVADIVFRAAQIRSAQAIPRSPIQISQDVASETQGLVGLHDADELDTSASPVPLFAQGTEKANGVSPFDVSFVHEESDPQILIRSQGSMPGSPNLVNTTGGELIGTSSTLPTANPRMADPIIERHLQSSKVPASRIGRLFHYGGLAASLSYGAASEIIRRSTVASGDSQQGSLIMSEANIRRLVSKLSQMRGAALKLGQFMSIQDTHILPPELDRIFRRVQDSAHYMPDWQMEEVMTSSLGSSWVDNFTSFDRMPFAAASIGQVHNAILSASASPTGREERVAVKIQFPNIANSIASDLGYVKLLLTAGQLLPKGLYLDRTVQVMKDELADECDYSREAQFLRRYRSAELLGEDTRFRIPWVWEGSTERVLVMEHVDGVSVGELAVSAVPQEERNEIARRIIELCLRELFEFRLMQTDPNWSNFLWSSSTRQISLVDFGATREYTKEFIDKWLHLLQGAAVGDRDDCAKWSLELGYLTGKESEIMLNAHIDSIVLLAAPFRPSTLQPFAFGPGTGWADITGQIRALIPVMLQHRLTPPPPETYSLNRKLSGAFLLASRLGAVVDTRRLWEDVVGGYQFDQ